MQPLARDLKQRWLQCASQLGTSSVVSLRNVCSGVMRRGVRDFESGWELLLDECGGRRRDGSVLVPQGKREHREMDAELCRV
jgi:hypothetical protein